MSIGLAAHTEPPKNGSGEGPDLPRVLILGDSISIGYTPFVQEMLRNSAVVIRPMLDSKRPENCAGTTVGVREMDRWLQLDGGKWDVIHFNWGLHDLKREDPETGKASNLPQHPHQANPELYEKQLRQMVAKLKATGARLIFATTTPVPEGGVKPHRDVQDVGRYNRMALGIMRGNGIQVNDLYSLALPLLMQIQLPVNVHFTREGSEILAREVVRHIRNALPSKKKPETAQPSRPPNVIVIMTDDQGTIDANCYGAEDLVTPALDELAYRGVRFKQFYSGAPVCSPSRAALLTGRYPVRAGMPGNASSSRGVAGMPAAQVTLAETLKAAGYVTAHFGKWHLGYEPGTMPNAQGFDYSFGHMGGCIDNYSHFFYWAGPNRHDLWKNGEEIHRSGNFFPDLMVEEAEQFIERQQDKPFFIYFALNLPHYPYQGEACWLKHYQDLPYPRNLYAAFVSTLDARVHRLLVKLDESGLRRDTIVIYQSDNGYSTEERAHFGGGSAGPYRGAKFSLFEGGIRVPAIISWPGHMPEGQIRDQLAHGCDWLPTLAELCGAPLLNQDIDGKSLLEVIESSIAPSPHTVLHWTIGKQWAVRSGDWKLIVNPQDTSKKGPIGPEDKMFLANLKWDASEMTNYRQQHPQEVKLLQQLHEEWSQSLH